MGKTIYMGPNRAPKGGPGGASRGASRGVPGAPPGGGRPGPGGRPRPRGAPGPGGPAGGVPGGGPGGGPGGVPGQGFRRASHGPISTDPTGDALRKLHAMHRCFTPSIADMPRGTAGMSAFVWVSSPQANVARVMRATSCGAVPSPRGPEVAPTSSTMGALAHGRQSARSPTGRWPRRDKIPKQTIA